MCNKAFTHKRWYYKNGQYFCTKRCWKKFAKEKKEKAAKEAQEREAAKKEETKDETSKEKGEGK